MIDLTKPQTSVTGFFYGMPTPTEAKCFGERVLLWSVYDVKNRKHTEVRLTSSQALSMYHEMRRTGGEKIEDVLFSLVNRGEDTTYRTPQQWLFSTPPKVASILEAKGYKRVGNRLRKSFKVLNIALK